MSGLIWMGKEVNDQYLGFRMDFKKWAEESEGFEDP